MPYKLMALKFSSHEFQQLVLQSIVPRYSRRKLVLSTPVVVFTS